MPSLTLSFFVVITVLLVAWWWLFGLSRQRVAKGPDTEPAVRRRSLLARWRFTGQTLGGFSYTSLILVSVFGLFLELLIIRWVSSEIRIFAYFKNFVLIACFLGFGMGCFLCRRPIHLWTTLGALILVTLLIELPVVSLRNVIDSLPNYLGTVSDVHIWGLHSLPWQTELIVGLAGAVGVTVSLFLLISLIFIPVGQLVGWYLENARYGIMAYTVNVLGSLAGILLYTVLCFLDQGPAAWFAIAGVLLTGFLWKVSVLRWTSLLSFAACTGIVSLAGLSEPHVIWSPYQKLSVTPVYGEGRELLSYQLRTNNSWYQQIIDLSDDFVSTHEYLFENVPIELNAYNLSYRFHPAPESVLILGSGMGNDVAAALRNGADRVVAVEIDPLILKLGSHLHFEKPYLSPKVEVVVDDARNYIENTNARFDMIVFSLLDSHTTSSHFSNIRTDNYVYTVEALEATRRALEPDGVLVLKFQVETPWIAGRLHRLLTETFGREPLQIQAQKSHTTIGRFFVTGSEARMARVMSDPAFAAYVLRHSQVRIEPCRPTIDDWPYFYQREPGLPASVVVVSVTLLFAGALAIRGGGTPLRSIRWHFFFLGAGFMLLEVQIVSKTALLFGATWVVNSIVIAALLMMIVAANVCAKLVPKLPTAVAYAGLTVTILVSYVLPPRELLVDSLSLRVLTAGGVLCAPAFFASLVFIRSFARAGFGGEAIGSNLFGSLVGGLLESLSYWLGIEALLLIAGGLYAASLIALPLVSRQAIRLPTGAPSLR
jgi:SAM-dependent methyltransferase